MVKKLDRLTPYARITLTHARNSAQYFQHDYIGPEHLLFSLPREGDSMACFVLAESGVNLEQFYVTMLATVIWGDNVPRKRLTLEPQAKLVIEFAVDEARQMGHARITTAHILLGLLRLEKGTTFDVLQTLGIELENARQLTLRAIREICSPEAHDLPPSVSTSAPDREEDGENQA